MNANQENPVFVCSLKAISTLWSTEKQKKLITLSDMIKFDGDKPYKIVDTLATYSMINPELLLEKTNSELFEKKVPGNLIEVVGDVHVFAIECGLKKTRKKAASLLARLLSNEEQLKEHGLIPYDGKELHYAIERIRDSFKDEVEDRTFLSLTLDEKEWYEETLPAEILADLGLYYEWVKERMTFGFSVLNLGTELSKYDSVGEPVGPDVQLGATIHPQHLPLTLSLAFHNLTRDREGRNLFYAFDDFSLGGEFVMGKVIRLRFGYENELRHELYVPTGSGLAGFSGGIGVHIKRYDIDFAINDEGPDFTPFIRFGLRTDL